MPIQVFEARYRKLVQDCLDGDSRFGVVLIKSGSEVGEPAVPHSTGTVARIVQADTVGQGRMFLAVKGQQRFEIKNITQYHPYIAAQVRLLEDADLRLTSEETDAVHAAVTQHMRLLVGLRGGWIREANLPSDAVALPYLIARVIKVGLQERQSLLEEPSASKRLALELDLLRREEKDLRRRVVRDLRRRYSKQ